MTHEKILITGASGLLGRQVLSLFRRQFGPQVLGLAHSRTDGNLLRADLLDPQSTSRLLREQKPALIVHCAAERRPDVSEQNPAKAEALNIGSTALLLNLANELNARLILISTDYVFDGTSPPYTPLAAPHPLNFYGRTKFEAEKLVLAREKQDIILRVPALYGPVEYLSESPISVVAQAVLSENPLLHDHWSIRYPTHTTDVALVCAELSRRLFSGERLDQIYHWSGDEPLTKYEIAQIIAHGLGKDPQMFKPILTPQSAAPRPKDCHLDKSRTSLLVSVPKRDFSSSIMECIRPFIAA